jgi:hypothetical protein
MSTETDVVSVLRESARRLQRFASDLTDIGVGGSDKADRPRLR